MASWESAYLINKLDIRTVHFSHWADSATLYQSLLVPDPHGDVLCVRWIFTCRNFTKRPVSFCIQLSEYTNPFISFILTITCRDQKQTFLSSFYQNIVQWTFLSLWPQQVYLVNNQTDGTLTTQWTIAELYKSTCLFFHFYLSFSVQNCFNYIKLCNIKVLSKLSWRKKWWKVKKKLKTHI